MRSWENSWVLDTGSCSLATGTQAREKRILSRGGRKVEKVMECQSRSAAWQMEQERGLATGSLPAARRGRNRESGGDRAKRGKESTEKLS